ncbi:MAG: hypothetical protein A3G18_11980 [Rhodospirillales bacterium RIFCSPLOWO2_12_FULL_58_28]|nr:MAG: hypothetical protein A3H92_09065 [Rhodospirillales bacterium RIFCSPLOWO2_02_FULL_58_16]OHC78160.1 MAG: hypothetical protein A3G18_11980 [Rhodospirillales bacterium RIFCSPLOWO2_12_FULL_58_28]
MSLLNEKSVTKVRCALAAAGCEDTIIELDKSIRTAEEAAAALGVEPGAVVQAQVFKIGKRFVIVFFAGDCACVKESLPRALNMEGEVIGAGAGEVRGATGFSVGGVAPTGLPFKLPMLIDRSLKRFETLYVPAGHPHCVFATTVADLKRLSGGVVSYNIAAPL